MTDFLFIFNIAVCINIVLAIYNAKDYWKSSFGELKQKLSSSSRITDNKGNNTTTSTLRQQQNDKTHQKLLQKYLVVYLLATFSDWLQGPYVYALYDKYGFSQHDIAILFVAGYGSSMIFGSVIGGMADWGGRRNFVILFCIIYGTSCVTKHFQNFYILFLGRLLSGISTSLLFSVFEAWLIRSHSDYQIKSKQYLAKSFSWASYCNSIIAILAGLVANYSTTVLPMTTVVHFDTPSSNNNQNNNILDYSSLLSPDTLLLQRQQQQQEQQQAERKLVQLPDGINNNTTTTTTAILTESYSFISGDIHMGGYLNPFDIALCTLILCGICAFFFWEENYGDDSLVVLQKNDNNRRWTHNNHFTDKKNEEQRSSLSPSSTSSSSSSSSSSTATSSSTTSSASSGSVLGKTLSCRATTDTGATNNASVGGGAGIAPAPNSGFRGLGSGFSTANGSNESNGMNGDCGTLNTSANDDENNNANNSSNNSNNNSGSSNDNGKRYGGLRDASIVAYRSPEILLCGIISSIFEGSMYIFVFMWTPALRDTFSASSNEDSVNNSDDDIQLPFGLIFSTFMVCCMAGSAIFSSTLATPASSSSGSSSSSKGGIKIETLAFYECIIASISMYFIAYNNNTTCKFIAMNVFEVVVGMYFPTMGTMKSNIVPEDKRAAIYNLYRIPLNFIVLFSLLTDLTPTSLFYLNGIMLFIASILQYRLCLRRGGLSSSSSSNSSSFPSSKSTTTKRSSLKTMEGNSTLNTMTADTSNRNEKNKLIENIV